VKLKSWRRVRLTVQTVFVLLILGIAIRHQLAEPGTTPSLHSLCPFGAVASIGSILSSGTFTAKLHPSNLVLAVGLLLSLLVVGPVFCGWVCPLGAVQDFLTSLRRRLGWRERALPRPVHGVASWIKFAILALIIWGTFTSTKLVFGPYDPYYTLFSFAWLFEPEEVLPISLVVTGAVVLASLLIKRAWCRYLCPLGALSFLWQRLSFVRLRTTGSCAGCATACRRVCPIGSTPAGSPLAEPCVMCLDCVAACPSGSAHLTAGPARRAPAQPKEVSAS